MAVVKRDFFKRNTVKVARELLGCFLTREYQGKIIRGMITETESYRGEYDLASHASRGKTERNKIMYGEAGHAYVYLVYGMHHMLNIVTEEKDFPGAVLVRAVLLEGGKMLDGPGKLSRHFQVSRELNGSDLTRAGKIWIEFPKEKKKRKIIKSPRVGVGYARHCKDWKWNFRIE